MIIKPNFNFNINKTKNNKKIKLILIFIIGLCFIFSFNYIFVGAKEEEVDVDSLYENTYERLEDIDFSKIEDLLSNIESENFFEGGFTSTIKNIIDGTFDINAENLLEYIVKLLTNNLKKIFPFCLVIILISIVVRILSSFSPNVFKDGIIEIINFVAIGVIVVLIGNYILSVNDMVNSTIGFMQQVIDILFPILLVLLGAIGATSSVAIYSPITAILNAFISTIISKFLYPLYLFSFVLIIISSITNKIKLTKLIDFVSSLFKTALAFVFTIFSGVFLIKGISAGKFDSVSIYTAKFAVKNYIPIIGSYISDGFNYVMLSSIIVKNAIGLSGIILILVVILSPVIYLLVLKLLFSLTASIVDMVGSSEISVMMQRVSKITAYPIAIILGVAFMFIMSLSLLMCTANIV